MVRDLLAIENARATVGILSLPPDASVRLAYEARRKSTRASVAIEGNVLSERQLQVAIASRDPSRSQGEQEVRNYWRALDRVDDFARAGQRLTEAFVGELHRLVIVRGPGRRGERSPYRTEECPVVDSVTRRIEYGPPRPADVPELMTDLMAWVVSDQAVALSAVTRAGLFLHRFLSIHPYPDGNGRTGRLLTTAVLWSGSYSMRGFLSFDEYFEQNRDRYCSSLQMGLPMNFYEGRNNPDHTTWLEYFGETLALAATDLQQRATAMHHTIAEDLAVPWERLSRLQQQLLMRVLNRRVTEAPEPYLIRVSDAEEWFGISAVTAREWLGA